jgi:hypothetical protein
MQQGRRERREQIPGRNDFHAETDQAVPVSSKQALLRLCLEIRMGKPKKQILSYWKWREIL